MGEDEKEEKRGSIKDKTEKEIIRRRDRRCSDVEL